MDIKYWLNPSAFVYPPPKSTKDKNLQAMPRVGTGTCDGESGEKSEPIFYVYQLFHITYDYFQIKNQKEKEQSFIFPIKKTNVLRGNFIFLKNYNAGHRSAILRVL